MCQRPLRGDPHRLKFTMANTSPLQLDLKKPGHSPERKTERRRRGGKKREVVLNAWPNERFYSFIMIVEELPLTSPCDIRHELLISSSSQCHLMCRDKTAHGGGIAFPVIRSEHAYAPQREVLTFPIKAPRKDELTLTVTGRRGTRSATRGRRAGRKQRLRSGSFRVSYEARATI